MAVNRRDFLKLGAATIGGSLLGNSAAKAQEKAKRHNL